MELSEIFTTDRARHALSPRIDDNFWQKQKGTLWGTINFLAPLRDVPRKYRRIEKHDEF